MDLDGGFVFFGSRLELPRPDLGSFGVWRWDGLVASGRIS
jgi:hypothetical protein